MGIRQSINENPAITATVTGAIIVLALVFIIMNSIHRTPKAGPPPKAYFSDDDGQHFFEDDSTKIPPFDHNGKEADSAVVYKCGQTGTPFVLYLLKYNADGQKRMQAAQNQPNGHMMDVPPIAYPDTEVKKPGSDEKWVTRADSNDQFQKIIAPKCPDGSTTDVIPVYPEVKP